MMRTDHVNAEVIYPTNAGDLECSRSAERDKTSSVPDDEVVRAWRPEGVPGLVLMDGVVSSHAADPRWRVHGRAWVVTRDFVGVQAGYGARSLSAVV
jgi:hypothetical protein